MIMHEIASTQPLAHHACKRPAHLVETRGRAQTDARLFGLPSRQYHVECATCGVATRPVYSQRTAESLWLAGDHALVPLADMPALRVAAERSLLAA